MAKKIQYSVGKLLDEKLIRKIPPSKDKASESIRTAGSWLKEAKNNLSSKALRSCIISSYLAMFYSARGILFADGFRENPISQSPDTWKTSTQSKACWKINGLPFWTISGKHGTMTNTSTTFLVTEDYAESALGSAREFVERMKGLAKKK